MLFTIPLENIFLARYGCPMILHGYNVKDKNSYRLNLRRGYSTFSKLSQLRACAVLGGLGHALNKEGSVIFTVIALDLTRIGFEHPTGLVRGKRSTNNDYMLKCQGSQRL